MENTKFLDYNGLSKLVEKIKNTYVNKNEQYEANLKWGGCNLADSFGPIDAAMIPELGANRFAFGNPRGITIEYSNDGGSTWHDYGASDTDKVRLLSDYYPFIIGKVKSSTPANDMLRITIDTSAKTGINCYTALNKFVIMIGTTGSVGCYCTIQKALQSTPTNFLNVVSKVNISGWTGYNVINVPTIITYGNSEDSQYGRLRFIFGSTGNNTSYDGLTIYKIYAFGGVGWDVPSNIAKNGHLYNYDYAQNAIFPANITAKNFIGILQGNASSATKASQDGNGNTISSTYLKLIGGAMSGTITTIKDSKPAIDFRGQHDSFGATLNYDTADNEALAVNLQNSTTSFMVNSGTNGKTWTSPGKYRTVTPTLQIKGKCVSINKFIPDNATPTHTLEVNGSVKATSFDGTASRATYADKYSYNSMDRDFVYDAVDGGNHYIRCKDSTIIRANGTNLNKYEFIINSDSKGGCYIYDSTNAKGTTWSPNGISFEKAPANSLVAANGTFITAITNTEIQNEIDKAITL
nr:MAG TPA: hypothetical protein [Caudoviricetes sp.]